MYNYMEKCYTFFISCIISWKNVIHLSFDAKKTIGPGWWVGGTETLIKLELMIK